MSVRKPIVCALAVHAACASEPVTLDETVQASNGSMLKNPLDAPVGRQGVADLRTNQLVRVPASYFLDASIDARETVHHVVVRTHCRAPTPERRDTGLIVVKSVGDKVKGWTVLDARYNDDLAREGECPTCSRIDMGRSNVPAMYQVYAFSNRRTKAHCTVNYTLDGSEPTVWSPELLPPDWPAGSPVDLGGALVELGPFDRSREWIEVNTPNDGADSLDGNNTRMLLFDIGATQMADTSVQRARYVPVLVDDQANGDRDARIEAPGSDVIFQTPCNEPPCAEPKHFALVGLLPEPPRYLPPFAGVADVETTISLVRGPEESELRWSAPLSVRPGRANQCGEPVGIGHGRFMASLRAGTLAAYGDSTAGAHGDASWMVAGPWGPSQEDRDYYYRGTPNFLAFTMRVEARNTSGTWSTITTPRTVPNGAFGCDWSECAQTFVSEFELYAPTSVRLCVDVADPRIFFQPTWVVERNAPSTEIKLATFNVHHGKQFEFDTGDIENEAESRNLANLLATRGRFRSEARAVVETADDGPFEWAADVVTMQEHSWQGSLGEFRDQARRQSDLRWQYVWGYGKRWGGYSSYNSVFSHRLLVPDGGTLLPPATKRCDADENDSAPNSDGQTQCYNENPIDGDWVDFNTYVVPAQIAVRRWNDVDVPILVVSVMLQPDQKYESRKHELASVIRALGEYVREHPELVGATPGTNGQGHPLDVGVRIVLAGDFNFYPHLIGEHRWFVRELRRAFGYAVDASAAHRDSYANFYDMHTLWESPNGTHPSTTEPDTGVPLNFTHASTWASLDDSTTWWWGTTQTWPHTFPYWAGTYRGGKNDGDADGGHDRHDAVLLVGKGWAADDPVRGYVVMNTFGGNEYEEFGATGAGTPFAIRDDQNRVLAVDIGPWKGADDVPTGPGEPRHYRPQFQLTPTYPEDPEQAQWFPYEEGCTDNGCPAVESDHIPVGVRLRVTRRR